MSRRGRPDGAVVVGLLVLLIVVHADRSAAQPAPSPAPAAGAAPGPAAAATAAPAPAAPPVLPPGDRIGAAEVTIVGGNLATARERALSEALKQAVDQALGALVPEARAAQPKTVVQVLGKARSFVRRYRTLEEGEVGRGLYGVKIEAEIDESGLLRAFDRSSSSVTAAAAGGSGAAGAVTPSYLLVGAGSPELVAAASRAFTNAGARVEPAPAGLSDPGRAVAEAARAKTTAVAFVSGAAQSEGRVRGPGVESVSCTLSVRVLSAGAGVPVAEDSEATRSFAEREDDARADCFARAAAAAVPRVVPPATASRPGVADLRTVVLDADVIEPGAVPELLKQLRGIGSVSAVDVRRILPGRVELWVRSRLAAPALVVALSRDAAGPVVVSGAEAVGDLVRLRARLREGAASPGAADSTPPGTARPNVAPPLPPSPSPSTSPGRPGAP